MPSATRQPAELHAELGRILGSLNALVVVLAPFNCTEWGDADTGCLAVKDDALTPEGVLLLPHAERAADAALELVEEALNASGGIDSFEDSLFETRDVLAAARWTINTVDVACWEHERQVQRRLERPDPHLLDSLRRILEREASRVHGLWIDAGVAS